MFDVFANLSNFKVSAKSDIPYIDSIEKCPFGQKRAVMFLCLISEIIEKKDYLDCAEVNAKRQMTSLKL